MAVQFLEHATKPLLDWILPRYIRSPRRPVIAIQLFARCTTDDADDYEDDEDDDDDNNNTVTKRTTLRSLGNRSTD
ncbi:unnamed protein product [Diplocarpon coronariae]|uniref:Uncharacterized protein n=1 Tax=Diplocarpon coronariae TaxID=2795749 RepID=A0A218YTN4_9HELO|nr:hypothetical protein B2J93_5834 [Marssonina coronariae]